jgi:hypothetical protein|tara:strand:+ start:1114 stop:1350 length:237 start_codon:yes stop_codon:yes gene_type:complete
MGTKRIGFTKDQMISFLRIMQTNTDNLLLLQEAYMKEQQSLFHEKWKVRHLTRILKRVAPEEALTEEELNEKIHRKEH